MKLNSLFHSSKNRVLDSIHTHQKALMNDINLKIRVTYKQKTYTTHIIEWKEKVIIFEAPMTVRDYVILPHNIPIHANFVSKVALFETQLSISKSYSDQDKLYYVAEIMAPLEKKQQRGAFRLDILLDVRYDVITYENNSTNILSSSQGTCVNISIGGMCLVSKEQLQAKDKLALSFTLAEKPLTFLGEVLYIGEKNEQGQYVHRIRFIDLDAADMNQLNRLIFTVQREQIRRS